ncbi:MAG: ATP-binding cassette domain-containing protein, partial [Verrucomicrobiota bacterium]|nr:ATP-binding cassette domain-containing protein [Verrucomicrobiota bacterium]
IAGLEEITGGTISIDGKVVNHVLPKDRDIAMVFQNYALYPHMSVYDNMAFGLKMRKFSKSEIDVRVREAAALLDLENYLDRKPRALSGGQRQRVAVGRAIVRKPKVFLFDEPLSNLDAKLRVSTRAEISKLHIRLGATMIYVTHDQAEAMTMGDRICVMKDGAIMQVAEPLELYDRPANLFVAGFIGSPPMNFFKGKIAQSGAALNFVGDNGQGSPLVLRLDAAQAGKAVSFVEKHVVLGLRPEDIGETADVSAANFEGKIEIVEPMGAETHLHLSMGTAGFIARVRPTSRHSVGQKIGVAFAMENAHLFDAATGLALW